MTTFTLEFYGRPNLAIGLTSKHKEVVEADDFDKAVLKLYEKYEHIHQIKIVSQVTQPTAKDKE